MNAITVVYPPSLRIDCHRACLHKSKEAPNSGRNTLETNKPASVESLTRVYIQTMRYVTLNLLNYYTGPRRALHAKLTNELENSKEVGLEHYSKPVQDRRETLTQPKQPASAV